MNLHPRQLPKLRDQTLAHLDDPASALRSGTGPDKADGLDLLASMLRNGALYWTSQDMSALAVSAGSQLAAAEWGAGARPSGRGLLVFDGGVGAMDSHGADIPVEACAWGPHGDLCAVWLLMSRRRLADEMAARRSGLTLVTEQIPPLIPIYGFTVPAAGAVPMVEVDPQVPQTVVGALAAAWLLMGQPTLVDTSTERPDRAVRKAYARQGRPDPEVTLVDLRRQYVPQGRDGGEGEQGGRRYRHRWVVSGHWRDQPYGPERSLRRKTWIPAYIKGPDGAPMLTSEKVNVWKR